MNTHWKMSLNLLRQETGGGTPVQRTARAKARGPESALTWLGKEPILNPRALRQPRPPDRPSNRHASVPFGVSDATDRPSTTGPLPPVSDTMYPLGFTPITFECTAWSPSLSHLWPSVALGTCSSLYTSPGSQQLFLGFCHHLNTGNSKMHVSDPFLIVWLLYPFIACIGLPELPLKKHHKLVSLKDRKFDLQFQRLKVQGQVLPDLVSSEAFLFDLQLATFSCSHVTFFSVSALSRYLFLFF